VCTFRVATVLDRVTLNSRRLLHLRLGAGVVLVLWAGSCNKNSPTSPRSIEPVPDLGTAARDQGTPALTRLQVIAPAQIAPGESIQLTARATRIDGVVEDVTTQAQWTTVSSPVLQLSATGFASGGERGREIVTTRFGGMSASAQLLVLPAGTFALSGSVLDGTFGLADVRVTVVSGAAAGLTTTTAADGTYSLYGVSGPLQVRFTKHRYEDALHSLDVSAHRALHLVLVAGPGRTDYRGVYTLTIAADSSCRLPPEAQRRVYRAIVNQNTGYVTVSLSEAEFVITRGAGGGFAGFADAGDALTFELGTPSYYWYSAFGHYDIVDRLSPGVVLVFTGKVTAKGTPQLITGTLAGTIFTASPAAPFPPLAPACESDRHTFSMVRR
jgi:hypothetical protein